MHHQEGHEEDTMGSPALQRRACLGLIGGSLAWAASARASAQSGTAAKRASMPHANQRMLLMSSSRHGSQGFLEHAQDQFAALYGQQKFNILFIPYAAVTYPFDVFEKNVQQAFVRHGHTVQSIHHARDPRAAVEQAQAIAIGGGNTFALLKRMYDANIVDAVAARVRAGVPFVGWSAGGNVAGPSIRTTNDMPIAQPPSFAGLNLIPFQTNPHFVSGKPVGHNGESREERLAEFLAFNPGEELIALPEGTALLCEGIQATVMGAPGVLWFRQGGTITPLQDGTRFALSSIRP